VNKFKTIFIVVGLIILLLLFYSFGVEKTINDILSMGWKFWIIVAIFLFNNIFMTIAWKVLINYPLDGSHFMKLLLARIAGDSTSSVNAAAAYAGEALKAMYIKDHVPFKIGLASVVLDRTVHVIATILMTLTGIFAGFFVLNIPLYISISTFCAFLLMLGMMVWLLKKQKEGFTRFLIMKLPARWVEKFMNPGRWEKVGKLDEEISFIFSSRENMKRFYISLAIHYLSGFITSSLEVYLIIIFSGKDITFIHAMFLYVFSMFLTGMVFFMPANLGTSEGSYSLALKFLGYDPAIGLTVGIIRRLRTFVWSGIGIAILFHAGLLKKEKGRPTSDTRS
jgi:glycosyltransferase 2 family protein